MKNGDGSADVKPIAHLYKTEVYAMAAHLGAPPEVLAVRPTTNTFTLPQGQDEFYFGLPYEELDIAMWHFEHGRSEARLAEDLGIEAAEAAAIYEMIAARQRAASYLGDPPAVLGRASDDPVTPVR